jgi:hypothetical protein
MVTRKTAHALEAPPADVRSLPHPGLGALALLTAAAGVGFVVAELVALTDLYSFEWAPLLHLLSPAGVAIILVLNCGLLLLAARAFHLWRGQPRRHHIAADLMLLVAALAAAWVLEWMFMTAPLTASLEGLARHKSSLSTTGAPEDFARFSLVRSAADPTTREHLAVMYERIRINNPNTYARNPIGATIDRNARRYGIDPALLFFLNYIDSFYGEAAAGPIPFLDGMTGETIRDTVQIHLPGWFVESRLRRWLTTSSFFTKLFGEKLGFKLRYAAQKFTLDVSMQPYALNTFSDVFLVLKEYPREFPEIFSGSDPLSTALRDSFLRIRDSALLRPYELPYAHAPYPDEYYTRHRDDLKRFARAAFYSTVLNFDFATRVQALLSRYQSDYYRSRIGVERWDRYARWQQVAMLAMIRDMYTVNVGHPGYNRYAVPELNCTPLEFVAAEAIADAAKLEPSQERLWRPKNYLFLWGGAGFRLRVMNEVWALAYGQPMPRLPIETSWRDAQEVLQRFSR